MAVCDADPQARAKHASPRQVAGGPLGGEHPEVPAEAAQPGRTTRRSTFTSAQWARLQAAFPDGVCDWSEPRRRASSRRVSPLTFADGPGGEPLPRAPQSHPGHDDDHGHDGDDD